MGVYLEHILTVKLCGYSDSFNPDPTVRHTFWTLVVGNYLLALPYYTVDQQMVQRYASTKSTRQAKM